MTLAPVVALLFFFPNAVRADDVRFRLDELKPVVMDEETAGFLGRGEWEPALDALLSMAAAPDADRSLDEYLAVCHDHLGRNAFKAHQYADAAGHFNRVLELRGQDWKTTLKLGFTYSRQAMYTEAEKAFTIVTRLQPKSHTAYKHLGHIYYLTNRLEDALAAFSTALELKPGDASMKKRVARIKKLITAGESMEVEADQLFEVSFDGEANPELRYIVLDMLQDAYFEIGRDLNAWPNRQIAVTLLTREKFRDITNLPEWIGGVYEGQIRIPVKDADPERLKSVLFHEYVHAVIFDLMPGRCPWWLNEGLAQYFEPDPAAKELKLKMAAERQKGAPYPALASLTTKGKSDVDQIRRAYASAFSAVNFLVDEAGIPGLQILLDEMANGGDFDSAVYVAASYDTSQFEAAWHEHLELTR